MKNCSDIPKLLEFLSKLMFSIKNKLVVAQPLSWIAAKRQQMMLNMNLQFIMATRE